MDATKATTDIKYYIKNIAAENSIQYTTGALFLATVNSNILFYLNLLLSFLYLAYLMMRIPHKEEPFGGKGAFSILRSKAGTLKNEEL